MPEGPKTKREEAMRVVILLVGLLLLRAPALAQHDHLAVMAVPDSSVGSTPLNTERNNLSSAKKTEYRLLISKKDGKYFWDSRGGGEMVYIRAGGAAHVFVPIDGNGYVKIIDLRGMPQEVRDMAAFTEGASEIVYFESISQTMMTITYFGSVKHFEP